MPSIYAVEYLASFFPVQSFRHFLHGPISEQILNSVCFCCFRWSFLQCLSNILRKYIALHTCVKFVTAEAFYNLGSGSWLAWTNDTATHYAVIRFQSQAVAGTARQNVNVYTTR